MSYKTMRRLAQLADRLEAVARFIVSAIDLVVIDATHGHGRNRRRSARPFVRNYNQTIVYHEPMTVDQARRWWTNQVMNHKT
jgi:hypothetical protein